MSENLNLEITDEKQFRETYPNVASKSELAISLLDVDLRLYRFEHCIVYEMDPYTFLIAYIGISDNEKILVVGLEYSPDGALIGVSAEVETVEYD